MRATKDQHNAAIEVINREFGDGVATLADWTDVGSGYAILVADGYSEDIAADGTVHGALPRNTFLEPINLFSLRLLRVNR
jgi:hypothetical protein